MANMWSPKNCAKLEEIVPNEIEKRLSTWHCKACQLDFQERFNIVSISKDCHGKYTVPIRERVQEGFQCPYCSGKEILSGFNSFAAKYPEFVLEWDHKNNIIVLKRIMWKNR
ncbi:hypothetical protein HO995_02455 [Streptococcus suis]|nr:hypothetical protein [Streptococcus suis]